MGEVLTNTIVESMICWGKPKPTIEMAPNCLTIWIPTAPDLAIKSDYTIWIYN